MWKGSWVCTSVIPPDPGEKSVASCSIGGDVELKCSGSEWTRALVGVDDIEGLAFVVAEG